MKPPLHSGFIGRPRPRHWKSEFLSTEMPCSECQIRKLLKGPDYVLTTPVLMRLDDGVITDIVTDSEDHAAIERCIAR